MKTISSSAIPQQPTADMSGAWTPPTLDGATIDFYMRRGRHERARAIAEMIRSVFSSPAGRPSAEVRELPRRTPATTPRREGERAA